MDHLSIEGIQKGTFLSKMVCKGVKGWTGGGPSLYKTLLSTLWGMYKFSKIYLLTKSRGWSPQSPVITKAQLCMCNVQCLEPSYRYLTLGVHNFHNFFSWNFLKRAHKSSRYFLTKRSRLLTSLKYGCTK